LGKAEARRGGRRWLRRGGGAAEAGSGCGAEAWRRGAEAGGGCGAEAAAGRAAGGMQRGVEKKNFGLGLRYGARHTGP